MCDIFFFCLKVLEDHIRLGLEGEDGNLTHLLQYRVLGNDR